MWLNSLSESTPKGEPRPFEGLFGVFNDGLPDGWGRPLLDRALRSYSIAPEALSPLDRLTHVGKRGMGALLFEPDVSEHVSQTEFLDLHRLADESAKVLDGETEGVFQELLELSGSSTGARPKIMIGVAPDKSDWFMVNKRSLMALSIGWSSSHRAMIRRISAQSSMPTA